MGRRARRRIRGAAIVGLLAVLTAGAVAASPRASATTRPLIGLEAAAQVGADEPVAYTRGSETRSGGADTVAVIGDSITLDSSASIQRELEEPWWVNVRATSGSVLPDHVAWFDSVVASGPRAVVVNLGTNDLLCILANTVGPPFCRIPDYFLADSEAIERAFAEDLGTDTCTLGVTLWMWAPGENPVNEILERLMADGTIDGLVDWKAVVAEDPALYVRDWAGHPTPAGQDALAQLIRERVDAVCTLGPPTDLRAQEGDGRVTLDWEPPASDGGAPILSYQVSRDGAPLLRTPGEVTHAVDVDVTNGETHAYTVSARTGVTESPVTAAVTATPAALQPDLAVGRADRIFQGFGVHNTTGVGQTRRAAAPPGTMTAFHVRLWNGGDRIESHLVRATVPAGMSARFVAAGADVTAAVRSGTFQFADLPPGESRGLRVEVTANRRIGRRVEHPLLVTATSVSQPSRVDVGRIVRTTP